MSEPTIEEQIALLNHSITVLWINLTNSKNDFKRQVILEKMITGDTKRLNYLTSQQQFQGFESNII